MVYICVTSPKNTVYLLSTWVGHASLSLSVSIWRCGPHPGLGSRVGRSGAQDAGSVRAPPAGAGTHGGPTGTGTGAGLWHSLGRCLQGTREGQGYLLGAGGVGVGGWVGGGHETPRWAVALSALLVPSQTRLLCGGFLFTSCIGAHSWSRHGAPLPEGHVLDSRSRVQA